jgi:hypothetical protein
MFKKVLLKIFIIFICLFAAINHFSYNKNEIIEANISYEKIPAEKMPDELRSINVSPYMEAVGKTSITQPVFKTSLKIEN